MADLYPSDYNEDTEEYDRVTECTYYDGKTGRFSEFADGPVIVLKGYSSLKKLKSNLTSASFELCYRNEPFFTFSQRLNYIKKLTYKEKGCQKCPSPLTTSKSTCLSILLALITLMFTISPIL